MNRHIILILSALLLFCGSTALARETIHQFSIADVMEKPENINKLTGVSFYFGDQSHPSVKQNHGVFSTNKKTNAFNKSDIVACEWAMLTTLLQLHKRAQDMGADAVINIKSNYKSNKVSSATEYSCGAGNIVAGVALVGEIVKLNFRNNTNTTTATRQVGATGSAAVSSGVKEAQERLTELGYSPGPADGIMGSRTAAALGLFQDSQRLPVTGTANQQTLEALRNATPNQWQSTSTTTITPTTNQAVVENSPSVKPAQGSTQGKIISSAELKSMADPFAETMEVIAAGSKVEILRSEGEWLFVRYNGQEGFVFSEFVSQ